MVKLVQIHINQTDYDQLKSSGYNLCVAQKVNDAYTVACLGTFDYLPSTRVSWLPTYQVFGTNFFNAGAQAVVETNPVDIDFGQRATLDAVGVLKAEDVGSSGVITFHNEYGPIHAGLIGTSAGPDGVQRQLPIHVERDAADTGFIWLTPVDVVQIWFQWGATTGMMLSPDKTIPGTIVLNSVSSIVEIDLTRRDTASVQYQNGAWSTIASN
jgi:hypothetical protein